ncbi:MAG TPA: class I SAM-dependent methyltransferase [Candidatus Paceibacterota bacterium]|nr:class I SAM-dependent methyltransferase [Candidatus Paceibacterota bacterium]HMO83019.1 class I SAM-dependent methyltransferase [Candidatus Paceibacterota bacterium]
MEQISVNQKKLELDRQRRNVILLYDEAAPIYDESFEGRAEYQIPRILLETYQKYGITEGTLLDVGCGTGKLREYLGDLFIYKGIDISPTMIEEAKKRDFEGYIGAVEDIIKTFGDKSIDHITALSSLYFIKDWEKLVKEFERVARQSIFVSLEQFDSEVINIVMKERGITIYNHSASVIENPTEVIKNVFLWKRPNTQDRIFGDMAFKKLS